MVDGVGGPGILMLMASSGVGTVAAPITVTGNRCGIVNCSMRVAFDADDLVTDAIHVNAVTDFLLAGNYIYGNTGTITTVLKTTAPDAVRFDASIARVATGLAMFGDTRTVNIRRAAAVGYLADPALTLDLFAAVTAAAATDPATADRIATIDGGPSDADAPELPPDPALDGPSRPAVTAAGACPSCLDTSSVGAADRRTTRPGASWPGLPRTDATLYVHLTDETLRTGSGVVRAEGIGPVLADQVRGWLQSAEATVTVKPVIDIAGQAPVDGYEVPDRLREAVHLLHPADVFPYATNTGRGQDLDHTLRYRRQRTGGPPLGDEGLPDDPAAPNKDGPPDHESPPDHEGPPDIVTAPDQEGPPGGQTRIGNLNKLTRRHHRLKTHGGWQLAQPFPGIWIWRSPHGRHYLVDHTGTTPLGKTARDTAA